MNRTPFVVRGAVVALAWTFACVMVALLAARFDVSFDATSSREHRLAGKTLRVLDALQDPHEIIVIYNSAAADPPAARRSLDVLDAIDRASDRIQVTTIDLSSSRGPATLDQTLARLTESFAQDIARVRAGLAESLDRASAVTQSLPPLSDRLLSAGKSSPPGAGGDALRKFFDDAAAVARLVSRDLTGAIEAARTRSQQRIAGTPVPALDQAVADWRSSIADLTRQLEGVQTGLETVLAGKAGAIEAETQSLSRTALASTTTARDELAAASRTIDGLPKPALLPAARTLERSSAAIVIRTPNASNPGLSVPLPAGSRLGLTAIDLEALFPNRAGSTDATLLPDTRARTEDLVTAALVHLSDRPRPIVVLTHGTNVKLGPDFRLFSALVQRLRLGAADVVEWAVAVDAAPPPLTSINPGGNRPVIYALLPAAADSPETAQRMLKLAAAARGLIADGAATLVSLNPSTLPSIGQPDPLAEFLAPLGITADTARPLLRKVPTQTGAQVAAEFSIVDPLAANPTVGASSSPIARAIRGLRTDLLWCIPLKIEPRDAATIEPIVAVGSEGGSTWAESQWSEFRRVPADQRAGVLNPPAPDSARDEPVGPWVIAASIERTRSNGQTQRTVVVGSNGWFFDEIAAASGLVEGRPTLAAPGNLELFETSVHWLAHQDDLIASGASSAPMPLVPPIGDGTMRALRWGLIVGLPILVLLVGVLWRIVRG